MEQALTVKEAAKILNVHQMTVYRLISAGQLKAFRTGVQNHGGGLRIWPKELATFGEGSEPAEPLEEVAI